MAALVTVCERCYGDTSVGSHGVGECPYERRSDSRGRGADVTWPGGRTFENLADTPQTFYSPAELSRYLRAHNLEPMVRHVPVPGTDKSPHTTSWAVVTQETLDGAREMLERIGKGKAPEPQTYITHMTVTMTEVPGYVTTPIAGVHNDAA